MPVVESAKSLYVPGHSKTHFLVVLSANKPGQSLLHYAVKLYAKNPIGHVVTHKFDVLSANESFKLKQLG